MAYSLYRSAAASPGGFGQGLMALQSAIKFRDVKSDAGVKALQEVAINDFIARSNMAKQALGELGAFNRDQLMVDYYRDRDDKTREANKKTGKMAALLGLLGGSGVDELAGAVLNPRVEMQTERNFRALGQDYEKGRMGGFHPDKAVTEELTGILTEDDTSGAVILPGQYVPKKREAKVVTAKPQTFEDQLKQLKSALGLLK